MGGERGGVALRCINERRCVREKSESGVPVRDLNENSKKRKRAQERDRGRRSVNGSELHAADRICTGTNTANVL